MRMSHRREHLPEVSAEAKKDVRVSDYPGWRIGRFLIQWCPSKTHRRGWVILIVDGNSIRWKI